MSGQQIGTVIGGIIGAFVGAPQLGMAIGGLIGGLVDPQKIKGPRIGDGQAQSATDGTPIAWVMGTSSVAGTIVQVGTRRHVQVKVDSGGKGGPKQTQDQVFQDFCILVCESCSLRDSSMATVLMVEQDGQIVYDVRPGVSSAGAQGSAKWLGNVTFQFGSESQLPHPTMEAITGVGNTPAYRGSLTAVFTNFNVSNSGNRIPTFLFTVASVADTTIQGEAIPLQSTTTGAGWTGVGYPVSDMLGFTQDFHFDVPTSQFIITSAVRWGACRYIFTPLYGGEASSITPYTREQSIMLAPRDDGPAGQGLDTGWCRFSGGYFMTDAESAALGYAPDHAYHTWLDWWAARGRAAPNLSTDSSGYAVFSQYPFTFQGTRMMTGVRVTVFLFCGVFSAALLSASVQTPDPSGHTLSPIDLQHYVDPSGIFYTPTWTPILRQALSTAGTVQLSTIASRLCKRGGLLAGDIDVTDLAAINVLGYPIAKQASAADCLGPILSAFFCYGSEYDARMNFKRYGANVVLEVLREDLLEAKAANEDAVIRTPRSLATEFPRRIVGSYIDPAQNYKTASVAVSRSSLNVIAIGDQQLPIPVTMTANQAVQAVDKALKVAYATLQGTIGIGLTYKYLQLCAGDAIAFQGKRYVIDDLKISSGALAIIARYDRQSNYTSTVQAIPGNIPTPAGSRYSGPTNLIAMNLPALRPQDTYGIYLAGAPAFNSPAWHGAVVQVSYDAQASWQTCAQIFDKSTMGQLTLAEPSGGEPLTAAMNGDLNTVTLAQLDARLNAFALLDNGGAEVNAEIGQFRIATETATADTFQLTSTARGLLGTARNVGAIGNQVTMLDSVTFVPIDRSFAGRRLYFRTIGFGEASADPPLAIVYHPKFNRTIAFETASTGDTITTSTGDYVEVTGS